METNFSVGTYNISSDGVSVTYTSPSILSKEMLGEIKQGENFNFSQKQEGEKTSFDNLLKAIIKVPKED